MYGKSPASTLLECMRTLDAHFKNHAEYMILRKQILLLIGEGKTLSLRTRIRHARKVLIGKMRAI